PYQEACVMEPVSGAVIFAQNEHRPWPTASLAKSMLMLIVAERLDNRSLKLDDKVTASRLASKMGGSQVYLKEGEVFTVDEMMKAVVVHSANDASLAMAEYIAGSGEAFVQLMNERAAQLGMKDTHYYSVHGLPPAPGQGTDVSSAYDEALLARELVRHPQILKWSAITVDRFRAGTFELRNTNHLVFNYNGCDGLKTGFYYKAGFNVVATAQRSGMRLIAVVLGSPRKHQNFDEAAKLMSQGFASYEMKQIAKRGTSVGQPIAIKDGAIASITPVYESDAAIFLKRGDSKTAYKVQYDIPASLNAPITAGQKLGTAQVMVDNHSIATVALVAPSDVGVKPSMVHRLLGSL
ncbi:MAG TPA: D-alanyl-D-alanine carboxypeptidase family protein, partial [Candidatus Binataceae bacterium]|nr:D-alanyl-D-alanine carboxypeptidase family protein [Candidatus Binataceae bacterium]